MRVALSAIAPLLALAPRDIGRRERACSPAARLISRGSSVRTGAGAAQGRGSDACAVRSHDAMPAAAPIVAARRRFRPRSGGAPSRASSVSPRPRRGGPPRR